MGAIVPTLTSLTSALSGVNTVIGAVDKITNPAADTLRAEQSLALKQLKQRQNAQTTDLEGQTALQREKLAAETQAAEDARRAALRRAVARQRAAFGAQGVGTSGGSADAVLLGLFEESEAEKADRERLDDIRGRALDQDMAAQNQLNVLQVSQLKEKQRLERAASEGF